MPDPRHSFQPLPDNEPLVVSWPTPNRHLLDAPEKFFARTRVNPDYGKPGFTRDCGKRFHRGCDIAPVHVNPTGGTTRVMFTDCTTWLDFESTEPVLVPMDDVFCICAGIVVEAVTDPAVSDFGRHLVIQHQWPRTGIAFFTLYGHLAELETGHREFRTGQRIGRMGQTSRSADARNWMAVAPHLHFEVWAANSQPFDPAEFLRRYLPPTSSSPG